MRSRQQCLDELEGKEWEPPDYGSHLVRTCHQLRKKPIGEFTIEDLRIMIGQQIGLGFLIPLALDEIEQNPLAEGDFYPGDLLVSVLRVDLSFWRGHREWRARLERVINSPEGMPEEITEQVEQFRRRTA